MIVTSAAPAVAAAFFERRGTRITRRFVAGSISFRNQLGYRYPPSCCSNFVWFSTTNDRSDQEPLETSANNSQQNTAVTYNNRHATIANDDLLVSRRQKALSTLDLVRAYSQLAKARLSALVVLTTATGFVAAGPLPWTATATVTAATTAASTAATTCIQMGGGGDVLSTTTTLISVLMGTALCASSAAAYNQLFEVDRDALMKRTIHRPLVTGVLSRSHAAIAATLWGTTGVTVLWYGTDPVTACLGAANILLYAGIYTALKPITPLNTWVGAIVGAIPPVMGYTAAVAAAHSSGAMATTTAIVTLAPSTTSWAAAVLPVLDPIPLSLAATLYFWQLPHFLALSYMYRADYSRGGFAMLPCHYGGQSSATGSGTAVSADEAAARTATAMVRNAWYLGAVPLVTTATHVTSSMFAIEGLLINGYAIAVAHRFQRDRTNQNARAVFITSLWYLPCTLMLFLLHSKSWDSDGTIDSGNETENVVSEFIVRQIHAIRNKGRELCLHEQATGHVHNSSKGHGTDKSSAPCPVVLGTEMSKATTEQAARALDNSVKPIVETTK
jgi:heme o synthase